MNEDRNQDRPASPRQYQKAVPEHQDYLERYPHGYTCYFPRRGWKLPKRTAAAT